MSIDKISISSALPSTASAASGVSSVSAGKGESLTDKFSDVIEQGVTKVNDQLQNASKVSEEFLTEGKHEIHEVIIALEQADMSFKFMTEVRNKVIDAYQEIMRTQV